MGMVKLILFGIHKGQVKVLVASTLIQDKSLNIIISVLITSLCFGLIHFYNIAGLISTVALGIILQTIYIKSEKLINCIIIHALCNLFTILLIFL